MKQSANTRSMPPAVQPCRSSSFLASLKEEQTLCFLASVYIMFPNSKNRGVVCCIPFLSDDCFSVATQHRENVATSAIMQRRYGHVVTRVATPKDRTITEKTSTNNRAEKITQ